MHPWFGQVTEFHPPVSGRGIGGVLERLAVTAVGSGGIKVSNHRQSGSVNYAIHLGQLLCDYLLLRVFLPLSIYFMNILEILIYNSFRVITDYIILINTINCQN